MSDTEKWQPSAPITNLLKRAAIISKIRTFFSDRGILEVDTPSMSQTTVTDIYLVPFQTDFQGVRPQQDVKLYMITSPEYHMKRLLAAGSGPIYQIGKSFRNAEYGRYHNPEFSILEWYRPHYNMYSLMNEVDNFIQEVIDCDRAEILSYQQAFMHHLNIDPLAAEHTQLYAVAAALDLKNLVNDPEDRESLIQLLFTFGVEPHIGHDKPIFIYNYPASQASLAQISNKDHRVAERFEVYYKNVELANGFHELNCACEQRVRFQQDNYKRAVLGLPQHAIDEKLLAALEHGLPDCSGVALGVDRLVMLGLGEERLSAVMTFPIDRA
ncbi:elongation factor P--(R)-beta-lysine ligase [Candidatus Profftia tarda]|uniref:Elongation factor P--(R)-beta-lysine ligase n=1 Tax=Candidatus Profftia tarda TaxID=1177216 RepID=A0A8E4EXV0_9ENTR|nr:elongation factor P--(R)-beta-lysine ligase [Candidatus Profftia tarda]CAD6507383.1 Elongation factor P--(R)-beta-lysine ligase [Candidatus Profftia tarda]